MTIVKLVRHAIHDRPHTILCGRMPGVALGPAGVGQLGPLAGAVTGATAVFSSPQWRCQQTAAAFGLPVVVHPALDEIDFGDWTGRDFAELQHDPAWRQWNRDRDQGQAPGGETAAAAQARAVAFVMALQRDHPDGCVAVVTHGDIIKALICHVLGLPLQGYERFAVDQASVSTLVVEAERATVSGLNAVGQSSFDLRAGSD